MISCWGHSLTVASLALSIAVSALAQSERIAGPIGRNGSVTLTGHANPLGLPQYDRGPVEPSFRLGWITIVLNPTPAQSAALDQLLADQQDPASLNYHRWLTPEQYADRFGASQRDIGQIASWLQSEGFAVKAAARGRDWIAFGGTAEQIEKTFHASVHRYSGGGETHFALSGDPAVPSELGPLAAALLGLDDFYPKPPGIPRPANTSGQGLITLAPEDLATIYDVARLYQAGINGNGQKIAIVGETAIDLGDIQNYRMQYGLASANVQVIQTASDPGKQPPFLPEADLDLEVACAMAPGAELIYVYSVNVGDAVLYAIDQNLAPVLSESFTSCEKNVPAAAASSLESQAKKANSMGITWLAASGDTGAAGCDQRTQFAVAGLSVGFPASIPEVTAVGGTEFSEGTGAANFWNSGNDASGGSAQSYVMETAWNDTGFIGYLSSSGGGASTLFQKPAWQSGTGVPRDNARDLPDVSMDGATQHDPYNVLSGGQWLLLGGTSASTPVLAGVVALINQAQSAGSGLGNINPNLYQLAQASPAAFHDIVAGSNIVPCEAESPDCVNGQLGYSAGAGYDLVTGLGSVDVYNLVTGWNGAPAGTASLTSLVPASTTAGGATFMLAVNGSNFPAGSQIQWNGTGLPTSVVSSTQLQATVDASMIAAPAMVQITVAANGKVSNVLYFVVNASQAMAFSVSEQRVTKSGPSACTVPSPETAFLTTDATVYVFFQATVTANDRLTVSWLAPDGSVQNTSFVNLAPGNYCGLTDTLTVSNLLASQLGSWEVRLYDNSTLVFTLSFTVTLPNTATPAIDAVDNSASLVPQAPVAAGSIATIFGQNFGPRATAKTIPLPVSMSGVSVTVNGRPAPLFFVDPTQINFQVPLETPAGQATAVVTASGVPSAEFGFQVQDVEPGLYLAVNHKDGSINGPKHPAAVGDTLVVYLTGQGPLNQPSTDGVPTPLPPPLFSATKPYSATIGNVKATVTFLGLTPLLVAVGQANVHVPSLSTGAYPLVITVGGVASNSITINVK